MRRIVTTFIGLTLSLSMTAFAAAPKQLITHNLTDFESNAYVDDVIPSPYPTKAHSDRKVYWAAILMTCTGHLVNGKCSALIRIATDTPNPIDVGRVELDIETGEITPTVVRGNGYKVIVNGVAESTIMKDE